MDKPITSLLGNDRVTVPRVTTLAVRPTPPPEPWYMPAFRKLLQGTNTRPLSLTDSSKTRYDNRIDNVHDKTNKT